MKLKEFAAAALLLLLAAAMLLCACSGNKAKPDPTQVPDVTLSPEASNARILALAEACLDYGEFDYEVGLRPADAERMLYCMYRYTAPASEVEGYGKVPEEEALKTIAGVFPSMELPEIIRTKYEQNSGQELFWLNNCCYIRLEEQPARSFTVVSETEAEGDGAANRVVTVDAEEGGVQLKQIRLTLVPNDEYAWSVTKCEFLYFN